MDAASSAQCRPGGAERTNAARELLVPMAALKLGSCGAGRGCGLVCDVDDEATSRGVEHDIRVAGLIHARGTPTFVTEMGVFPGERGLAAAIASLSLSELELPRFHGRLVPDTAYREATEN